MAWRWSRWMSLGGELNGDPAAVLAENGRLVAFWRGTDHALWHRWQEPDFSWTVEPMSLGGDLNGDPAAVLAENGRLVAFWRGTEGTLIGQEQRLDFSWNPPFGRSVPLSDQPGGREVNGDPSAVRAENGALVTFLRGQEDSLWHRWQEPIPDAPPGGGVGVELGPDDPPPPPSPMALFFLTLFEDKSTPQHGDFAFRVPEAPSLAGRTITGVTNLTVDKSRTMLPIMLTHPNGTGPVRINPNEISPAFNGLGVPGRWKGHFPAGTFIVGTDEEIRIRANVTLV
jgi:hypothetical protein